MWICWVIEGVFQCVFVMKGFILAAGLGTRLRPLTDSVPKALVRVAGRPLIDLQVERFLRAGIDDIVVNVHHFASQVVDHVEREFVSRGVKVVVSDESGCLLDTGGAVRKAAPLLCGGEEDCFLVHNVDILSNADLGALRKEACGCAALLLVSQRKTNRYLLFDDRWRLCGWTDVSTGAVKSPYKDLDVSRCKMRAFAGIHVFSSGLFGRFEGWPERFSVIDFYLSVCDKEVISGCEQPGLKLLDVGKVESLQRAESFLNDLGKL